MEPDMGTGCPPRVLQILVVDDNRDLVDSTAILLGLLGHHVHTAYDGPSALALTQEHWPDVVLVDLAMPRMDGFSLTKRICEQAVNRPKPTLIALTGYGDEAVRLRVAAEGFDHFLLKPADPSLLDRLLKGVAQNGSQE
jgi:CheY-like chemotaxis protein